MSTTTEDNCLVSSGPTRRLIVTGGPWNLTASAITSLLPNKETTLILHTDQELPPDVKRMARDRYKFHLRLLLAGPTGNRDEYRVICFLKDSMINPHRVVCYGYLGVLNDSEGRGFLDEFTDYIFLQNPMIRSLFPDWHRVFKMLDVR